jgi:hypothetical protein
VQGRRPEPSPRQPARAAQEARVASQAAELSLASLLTQSGPGHERRPIPPSKYRRGRGTTGEDHPTRKIASAVCAIPSKVHKFVPGVVGVTTMGTAAPLAMDHDLFCLGSRKTAGPVIGAALWPMATKHTYPNIQSKVAHRCIGGRAPGPMSPGVCTPLALSHEALNTAFYGEG